MALTTNTRSNSMGVVNISSGFMVSNADAPADVEINLGFEPRSVRLINLTDRISFEFFSGMAMGDSLKTVAAGTRTLDSTGAVAVAGSVLTFAAGALPASKEFAWEAVA